MAAAHIDRLMQAVVCDFLAIAIDTPDASIAAAAYAGLIMR